MDPATEFEIGMLRRQLRLQRIVTAVVVSAVVVGTVAWGLVTNSSGGRRSHDLRRLTTSVDSLARVAATQRTRLHPLEQEVETFGTAGDRIRAELRGKADRLTVQIMLVRLAAIDAKLAHQDSTLADIRADVRNELARRTHELATARHDSLTALRHRFDTRIDALAGTTRATQERVLALDTRLAALQMARQRDRPRTAVRDATTLVSLGLVTGHLITEH
jgi:chromosome segregation ATPase